MTRKIVSFILSASIHVLLLCALSFHAAKTSGVDAGTANTYMRAALVSAAGPETGKEPSEEPTAGLASNAANEQTATEAPETKETPAPEPEPVPEPAPMPEPVIEMPKPVVEEPKKTVDEPKPVVEKPVEVTENVKANQPTPKKEPTPAPSLKPASPKPAPAKKIDKNAQPPAKTAPPKAKADKKNAASAAPPAKTDGGAKVQPQTQGDADGKHEETPAAPDKSGGAQGGSADNPASAPASAPSPTPAVFEASDLKISKKTPADYPQISRKRREQGTVILLAEISSGAVVSVKVERGSGHAPLDESAVRALRQWRFEMPPNRNNITARVPFVFKLK
jgi:TonB family protein